jgi:hypothetical protein
VPDVILLPEKGFLREVHAESFFVLLHRGSKMTAGTIVNHPHAQVSSTAMRRQQKDSKGNRQAPRASPENLSRIVPLYRSAAPIPTPVVTPALGSRPKPWPGRAVVSFPPSTAHFLSVVLTKMGG